MLFNVRILYVLAAFFVVADIAYVVWTLAYDQAPYATDPTGYADSRIEWAGTVALLLAGVFALLVGFYLHRAYRAQGGDLPEDRDDANIDDGDAEVGDFSPWSWWPIAVAMSAGLVFLGLAAGVWLAFGGVALFAISIVGWIYEYYRGYFAH